MQRSGLGAVGQSQVQDLLPWGLSQFEGDSGVSHLFMANPGGFFINWEEGKKQHCPGPLPAADMRGGCAAGLSLSSGEQGSSPPSRGELLTPCGRAADFPGIMQGRFCRGSSFASLREYPGAPRQTQRERSRDGPEPPPERPSCGTYGASAPPACGTAWGGALGCPHGHSQVPMWSLAGARSPFPPALCYLLLALHPRHRARRL